MKTFLDPKESQPTPVKPLPIPEPAVSPNWGMACNLFRFAGVHQAIEKPLRALKKEYDAEVAKLNGLSYEDARAEFAANVQAVLDGKRTHSEFLPTKEQLKERNSLARRVIKARAAAVSQKAEVIAADAYEEALKKMPEFRKQLLDYLKADRFGNGILMIKQINESVVGFRLHVHDVQWAGKLVVIAVNAEEQRLY